MTTPSKIFTAVLITASVLFVSSCKKEVLTTTKTKQDSTITSEQTREIASAMIEIAFPENGASMSFKTEDFPCLVVTVDSSSMPYVKTYDYGEGCVNSSGEYRKGIMRTTYNTEDYLVPGMRMDFSFSNFFLKTGEQVGTMTIENTGPNGNGNRVISYVADFQIITPSAATVQMDIEQYYEWTEGFGTPDYSDDVFSLTGFYRSTVVSSGDQSSVTITQPLIRKRSAACKKYYVEGITLTETTGEPDRYLDYGDGTCDNLAVETVNGEPQTITLP